ncbi:MAG: TIGR00159 family protein [Holophagae bacterium]|nr:MAG: TIGR00159 family protein [Holophagae bacterium]
MPAARGGVVNWLIGVLRSITELKVGLADVVDILTVALLIYALLALLRGSRAMQMMWGIVAIAGLYLVASTLKLITLSTILGYLLAFLPIAIIVLFQQEIRRMLSAFGSTAWFPRGRGQDEGPVMINELALAVQALAAKRTGALIALERHDSLSVWADTGIALESRFSYDLILNIFIPGTPLHDGAVIIGGERIIAASCFLPLTTRHELSSELGSRHRAAIGLTEESDALVIVVSEETGIISLAVEQQLLRPLDETTLRNALAEHLYHLRPRREIDS